MNRSLKILTYSTLYPNAEQPQHGLFVEERLARLVNTGEVSAQVVAPIPWFPSSNPKFGRYARYARAPLTGERRGLAITYPRFPAIPRVGMSISPWLLARATLPVLREIRKTFPFDLIDAHYLYPDGAAAVTIGRALGVPVVLTARGSDVHILPRYRLPRRWILDSTRDAAAIVTVSTMLKQELARVGVDRNRITVLRNGVDLEKFHIADREVTRAKLGIQGPTLVSVGALIPHKGHHFAIQAMAKLPEIAQLLIVGEGTYRSELEQLIARLNLGQRVRLLGSRTHAELIDYYNAADALVLATESEGMANVLLESLACGTPILATAVSGNPEVVSTPAAGVLMGSRTGDAIVSAYRDLMARYPDRRDVRRHAETFGWQPTIQGLLDLLRKAAQLQ
jgi:teichuronic acid biosynthesis glycosyltransferase TuaC